MGSHQTDPRRQTAFWQEILEIAFAGLFPPNLHLERLFDRLEGSS